MKKLKNSIIALVVLYVVGVIASMIINKVDFVSALSDTITLIVLG